MAKKVKKEMSFLDHLEELRWLLVRSSLAIVIVAIGAFFFSKIFQNSCAEEPMLGTWNIEGRNLEMSDGARCILSTPYHIADSSDVKTLCHPRQF